LRPGGLFVACSPSRYDDPELVGAIPGRAATFDVMSFDSDDRPAPIAEIFGNIEVDLWEGPYTHLPDRVAVELYLYGRDHPKDKVAVAASRVKTPLTIANRGAVMYAYKRT
jgi:hypothetical protein